MKSLPRPTLALLMAAAALAPPGCNKPAGGVIAVTVIGDSPKLVDPAIGALPAPDAVLLGSIAQGLVVFDARGQIDAGLAERWTVTDDGLSYIFRLRSGTWPSGRKIDAHEVARILNRERREVSRNAIKDSIGAISEIVAMTDRVIEIRLVAPRSNLLQLLAQPEFAILRIEQDSTGEGSGPFVLRPGKPEEGMRLTRTLPGTDGDQDVREEVVLTGLPAPSAIARFRAGQAQMVLGGTFSDLPVVRAAGVARNTLRFDPVAGLFALVPARQGGPLADKALRSLVSRAIDRDALVAAFDIDGLTPRATLLQPGLDGLGAPLAPGWIAQPLAQRRAALIAEASRLLGSKPRIVLTVSFPAGPGSTLLFNRIAADLLPLGIGLEAAARGAPVDLTLIDEVAPSTSPAWFVRRVHCGVVARCDAEVDAIADAARETQSPQQRAQLLSLAAQLIDSDVLIIPLTAPVRWSLVSSDLPGFAENRFARHTLSDLAIKPAREGKLTMAIGVEQLKNLPGMGTDPSSVRQRVEAMEKLLEGLITIPGINRKIGLDVILDLVPVGGDIAGAVLGGYMIWEARNLGMSKGQMARMAGNVGIDFLIGLPPWIGAIPDFFFRSNTRNLKLIKRHLDRHHPETATVAGERRTAEI